ncbi:MAG: hypothetical protein MUF54_11035 [Polyangiaceae bacterium]|nr:hypothetical protein [Polyangiaceae bacterium]
MPNGTMPSVHASTGAVDAYSAMMAASYQPCGTSLTPESLMMYLQSRMQSVDDQINELFERQQKSEAIRSKLRDLTNELGKLDDYKDNPQAVHGYTQAEEDKCKADPTSTGTKTAIEEKIETIIAEIGELDASLARKLGSDLSQEGYIMFCQDGRYKGAEVTATKTYVDNIGKNLESDASLNMIKLQSMMSTRGQAIQLCTNLVSSVHESPKQIIGNMGR